MPVRFVISNPKTGKSYQKEAAENKISSLMGQKLGAEFDAGIIDLPGYHLKITGGSDKAGFPIKPGVEGSGAKKILLTKGVGFNTDVEGERKRKIVRGMTVGAHLAQINAVVVKEGKQTLDSLFGKETAAPKEAAPAEGKKE